MRATIKRSLFPNKTNATKEFWPTLHNKFSTGFQKPTTMLTKAAKTTTFSDHFRSIQLFWHIMIMLKKINIKNYIFYLALVMIEAVGPWASCSFFQQDVKYCMFLKGPKITLFPYIYELEAENCHLLSTIVAPLTIVYTMQDMRDHAESKSQLYHLPVYTPPAPKSYVPNFAIRRKQYLP
jgi:hypothetical protein